MLRRSKIMKMKKYLALVAALVMSVSMFTACEDSKKDDDDKKSNSKSIIATDDMDSSVIELTGKEKEKKFKELNEYAQAVNKKVEDCLNSLYIGGKVHYVSGCIGDYCFSGENLSTEKADKSKLDFKKKEDINKYLKSVVGGYIADNKDGKKYNFRILIAGKEDDEDFCKSFVLCSEPNIPLVGSSDSYTSDRFSDITDINSDEFLNIIEKQDGLKVEISEAIRLQVQERKNAQNLIGEMRDSQDIFAKTVSAYKNKLSKGDYIFTYTKNDKVYDLSVLNDAKNQNTKTILKYAAGACIQKLGGEWCLGTDRSGYDSGRNSYTMRFIVDQNKDLYIAVTSSKSPETVVIDNYTKHINIPEEKLKLLTGIKDRKILSIIKESK